MQDELDRNLQSLFRQHSQTLPEEPFLRNMLKLLEKQQARRMWKLRFVQAAAFACCALLSPFLIKGSEMLSGGLNLLFNMTEAFIATPAGMIVAGLCALPFLIFNRKLILGFRNGA